MLQPHTCRGQSCVCAHWEPSPGLLLPGRSLLSCPHFSASQVPLTGMYHHIQKNRFQKRCPDTNAPSQNTPTAGLVQGQGPLSKDLGSSLPRSRAVLSGTSRLTTHESELGSMMGCHCLRAKDNDQAQLSGLTLRTATHTSGSIWTIPLVCLCPTQGYHRSWPPQGLKDSFPWSMLKSGSRYLHRAPPPTRQMQRVNPRRRHQVPGRWAHATEEWGVGCTATCR